jgi:hypothetical protein
MSSISIRSGKSAYCMKGGPARRVMGSFGLCSALAHCSENALLTFAMPDTGVSLTKSKLL